MKLTVGSVVVCDYRPGHVGVALADDDLRAWPRMSADEARRHVEWCHERGLLTSSQPVLWPWGVMWDSKLAVSS